jgi:hypothetical protein
MLGEDWREDYVDFIRDQRLPAGMDVRSTTAARVMHRSKGIVLIDNKLYYGRTNLNYTGSNALMLSQKAIRTQSHFKQCNPVVCRVKS